MAYYSLYPTSKFVLASCLTHTGNLPLLVNLCRGFAVILESTAALNRLIIHVVR